MTKADWIIIIWFPAIWISILLLGITLRLTTIVNILTKLGPKL